MFGHSEVDNSIQYFAGVIHSPIVICVARKNVIAYVEYFDSEVAKYLRARVSTQSTITRVGIVHTKSRRTQVGADC
jgi:hypothetical protein